MTMFVKILCLCIKCTTVTNHIANLVFQCDITIRSMFILHVFNITIRSMFILHVFNITIRSMFILHVFNIRSMFILHMFN